MANLEMLQKKINIESKYDSLEEALSFGVEAVKKENFDYIIVRNAIGKYIAVSKPNWESALLLGYELVARFEDLSYLAHFDKPYEEILKNHK